VCGRYTISKPHTSISEVLGRSVDDLVVEARYNVAPSQTAPVVVTDPKGKTVLKKMEWGFIVPNRSKRRNASQIINTRIETAPTNHLFSISFLKHRCIVPADGFYEWQKREGRKQPYFFQLKQSLPFGFAGLWTRNKSPNGETLEMFSILTTNANSLVEPIHQRMPVILHRAAYRKWLTLGTPVKELTKLCKPYSHLEMQTVPVGDYVNDVQRDSRECARPVKIHGLF
tara:strand:- start:566 stop:1249 length:684 start_codon:yes stop_codon:yes gene_type:complete